MGITIHDRFENQIKKFLLERIDDSKKRGGYEENDDPYDDKFEELMNDDELYNSHENKYTDDYEKKEDLLKENMNSRPLIKNHPAKNSETYKMNTRSTIEHIRDQFDDDGKKWFGKMIDSGVGGTEGWRAHLKGTDSEYFMTSSSEKKLPEISLQKNIQEKQRKSVKKIYNCQRAMTQIMLKKFCLKNQRLCLKVLWRRKKNGQIKRDIKQKKE